MSHRFGTGICSVTFRNRTAFDVIALAAGAGLDAIEWGADQHVRPGDHLTAQRTADETSAAGLTVSSYGSYLRMPEATVAEIETVLATAATLGAPMVRIWPGSKDKPSSAYGPGERQAVAEAIERAAALADRVGLALGLEYHPHTLTDAQSSSEELMAAIRAPNVYLYWQPRPGLNPQEGLAKIASLGRHIAHLHVFQWNAQKARFPLVDGQRDWRRYLAAVPEGRWSGERYAMLEFVAGDDADVMRRDAETLRQIVVAAAEDTDV